MERLDKFLCDSGVGTRSQGRQSSNPGGLPLTEKQKRTVPEKLIPKPTR